MKHIAATAERGKFDMFFLGDGFATGYGEHPSTIGKFEPLTLLSALAMGRRKLGLAATGSTTYAEPYHVARGFASLDHLSGGRAGWNVVTTAYSKSAPCSAAIIRRMPSATPSPRSSSRPAGCCGTAGTTAPSSATRGRASS